MADMDVSFIDLVAVYCLSFGTIEQKDPWSSTWRHLDKMGLKECVKPGFPWADRIHNNNLYDSPYQRLTPQPTPPARTDCVSDSKPDFNLTCVRSI